MQEEEEEEEEESNVCESDSTGYVHGSMLVLIIFNISSSKSVALILYRALSGSLLERLRKKHEEALQADPSHDSDQGETTPDCEDSKGSALEDHNQSAPDPEREDLMGKESNDNNTRRRSPLSEKTQNRSSRGTTPVASIDDSVNAQDIFKKGWVSIASFTPSMECYSNAVTVPQFARFEEGIRAHVSTDLDDFAEQQRQFEESLEKFLDTNSQYDE